MTDAETLPPPVLRGTFHGTALVENYDRALEWLGRFCGCVALEFSRMGAPGWRDGGCCAIGDSLIELAEPNGPDVPTMHTLRKYGPGYLNLALNVADLKAACAFLNSHGAETTVPPERGFTFTRPSGTQGVQLEWAAVQGAWDPRFGAVAPPRPTPLIETPRIAWWGALVAEPEADAERLGLLMGSPPLFLRPDAADDEPVAAISLRDGLFVLYRLPAERQVEQRLWGKAFGRARLHAMAFRVHDLDAAGRVFERERVGVLRRAAGELVTDPADTVGLTMVWTDKDAPCDPRGPLSD
jgi:hypothetical protein